MQRTVVEVKTADGRSFSRTLDFAKGHPRNPLSDREVELEFSTFATELLSPGQQPGSWMPCGSSRMRTACQRSSTC